MLPATMRRARVATMIVLAAAACGKDGSGGVARSPTPGADTGPDTGATPPTPINPQVLQDGVLPRR